MTDREPRNEDIEFEEDFELGRQRRDDTSTVTIRLPRIRLFPRETEHHLRAAQREVLLAVRSVIDEAIRATEQPRRDRIRRRRIEIQ